MLPLPFPREVVRDLLGITRVLYRAEVAKPDPDPSRLARLTDIGRQYRHALDMGRKFGPDTMGGRGAISWAEKATEGLCAYVTDCEPLAVAVAASAARLRRQSPSLEGATPADPGMDGAGE